eukprot:Lithocolla_globosa_v1_NODE_85_length_6671_cov_4.306832.p5 type:complete len:114 gc:universal NODE_85_length_6671_cov_4.306832:4303-4644(+)
MFFIVCFVTMLGLTNACRVQNCDTCDPRNPINGCRICKPGFTQGGYIEIDDEEVVFTDGCIASTNAFAIECLKRNICTCPKDHIFLEEYGCIPALKKIDKITTLQSRNNLLHP